MVYTRDMPHPLDLEKPDPSAVEGIPTHTWDNPLLITQAVSQMRGLIPPDPDGYKAQYILSSRYIKKLEDVENQLGPNHSSAVDTEYCGAQFRRKLLAYRIFQINDLPVEILRHIFHYVTALPDPYMNYDTQRTRLASVCNYWRQVAIEDKVLWRTLGFSGKHPWNNTFLAMERADGAFLEVFICEPVVQGSPKLRSNHVADLFRRLMPKLSKVKTLSIRLDTEEGIWEAMKWLNLPIELCGSPSELQQLAIWFNLRPQDDGSPYFNLFDGRTPKLSNLLIQGLECPWGKMHGAELTTLDLRHLGHQAPDLSQFRGTLAGSPKLRRLVLHWAGPFEGTEQQSPIRLLDLHELFICAYHVDNLIYALAQFDAPALRWLELGEIVGDSIAVIDWFVQSRRFTGLQELALQGLTLSDTPKAMEALVRWFDSMPRLKSLKVTRVDTILFDALLADPRHHRSGQPPPKDHDLLEALCPKLSVFHLGQQDVQATCGFIRGREMLGVPFKRAFIDRKWQSRTLEEARQLDQAFPSGFIPLDTHSVPVEVLAEDR
ncbi:hypothetical protein NM688_g2583 [Phlebia brevispora]|uniref:Uncharacterized protein n=1 Tax=Phlebia brevispora TaxID=194682 RepID=A0ACC1T8E6_9APHY|nr:hypothetical protein NM688_g2583 [Phlebia brevispora]